MGRIGPFYDINGAAAYCGYTPEKIKIILELYGVPGYGDDENRFAAADLEAMMVTAKRNANDKRRQHNRVPMPDLEV